jgi:hypothetical protein
VSRRSRSTDDSGSLAEPQPGRSRSDERLCISYKLAWNVAPGGGRVTRKQGAKT